MARALVRNPELILADEPTGAQDRDHLWAVVEQLLKANASGASVILATHDREIVRRVRKRCAVLKAGKLQVEDGLCIF
jgi:cell division transport system ATP-binding protein